MPIRLLDMQLMVKNAPEVAKPVIAESLHHSAAQQNIAEKFTKESLLNEERVLLVEKPENDIVDEDGQGNSKQHQGKRKHQRKARKRNEDTKSDEGPENSFDISI